MPLILQISMQAQVFTPFNYIRRLFSELYSVVTLQETKFHDLIKTLLSWGDPS